MSGTRIWKPVSGTDGRYWQRETAIAPLADPAASLQNSALFVLGVPLPVFLSSSAAQWYGHKRFSLREFLWNLAVLSERLIHSCFKHWRTESSRTAGYLLHENFGPVLQSYELRENMFPLMGEKSDEWACSEVYARAVSKGLCYDLRLPQQSPPPDTDALLLQGVGIGYVAPTTLDPRQARIWRTRIGAWEELNNEELMTYCVCAFPRHSVGLHVPYPALPANVGPLYFSLPNEEHKKEAVPTAVLAAMMHTLHRESYSVELGSCPELVALAALPARDAMRNSFAAAGGIAPLFSAHLEQGRLTKNQYDELPEEPVATFLHGPSGESCAYSSVARVWSTHIARRQREAFRRAFNRHPKKAKPPAARKLWPNEPECEKGPEALAAQDPHLEQPPTLGSSACARDALPSIQDAFQSCMPQRPSCREKQTSASEQSGVWPPTAQLYPPSWPPAEAEWAPSAPRIYQPPRSTAFSATYGDPGISYQYEADNTTDFSCDQLSSAVASYDQLSAAADGAYDQYYGGGDYNQQYGHVSGCGVHADGSAYYAPHAYHAPTPPALAGSQATWADWGETAAEKLMDPELSEEREKTELGYPSAATLWDSRNATWLDNEDEPGTSANEL